MNSNSQALQDIFVCSLGIQNQTYIEIGAHQPVKWSNTYGLELQGWRGFGIELNLAHRPLWTQHPERCNKIYWDNALTFNYIQALIDNDLPMHLGYLSCDIEPPANTFSALQKVISLGISFDCITYEHDNYASEKNWNEVATNFLRNHGYKPAVYDVYPGEKKHKIFETWFVRATMDLVPVSYEQWKSCLNL